MEPKICPYLGLRDEPKSYKDFPFEGNTCYRAKRPVQVALSHQRGFCLCDEHTHCPGYIDGWAQGFPDSLKAFPPTYKRVLQSKWAWAVLAVVLLVSIYFIFQGQIGAMAGNLGRAVSSRNTATPVIQPTSEPTRTPNPPTRTSAPPPTATSTIPAPTATPTAVPTDPPSQAAAEPTPYMVEVNANALNIRTEPLYRADGSNIVERLVRGEIIEVLDEEKGWLLTEKGWIFKAYTKKIGD